MWGVEVGITPGRVKRWHDRHRAHTLPRDPVSVKVRTDAPVTIRLLIPTPAQRVSLI